MSGCLGDEIVRATAEDNLSFTSAQPSKQYNSKCDIDSDNRQQSIDK